VADGRVLALIEAFLKAGIMDGLEEWTPGKKLLLNRSAFKRSITRWHQDSNVGPNLGPHRRYNPLDPLLRPRRCPRNRKIRPARDRVFAAVRLVPHSG
jgi:hypothetical protein